MIGTYVCMSSNTKLMFRILNHRISINFEWVIRRKLYAICGVMAHIDRRVLTNDWRSIDSDRVICICGPTELYIDHGSSAGRCSNRCNTARRA